MDSHIGADIRALRKGRKMTLQEVAQHLGRSPAWLSLVERGSTAPSIRDLGGIADLFGIQTTYFFRSSSRSEEERGLVLRAEDRIPIGSSATGLVEELLSPRLDGRFEMIKSTFSPRSASEGQRGTLDRDDAGVLLSGTLTFLVGDREVRLSAGDSFHFQNTRYAWRNDEDIPAVVIWVVAPVVY
jgi:transcriptional regulator with XRE-family HTH domain